MCCPLCVLCCAVCVGVGCAVRSTVLCCAGVGVRCVVVGVCCAVLGWGVVGCSCKMVRCDGVNSSHSLQIVSLVLSLRFKRGHPP